MFVRPEDNYAKAMALWNGEPAHGLTWTFYFSGQVTRKWLEQTGYAEPYDFFMGELGCLNYADLIHPIAAKDPAVEVAETRDGELKRREYRSPYGTLSEVRKGPRLVQHRVRSAEDLRVLIDIWKHRQFTPLPKMFDEARRKGEGKWPVVPAMGPSALQHMIQTEFSVEDFWYAMADYPGLMEEAMEVWQGNAQKQYDLITPLPADAFYQDENTSTTLISPAFYQKYSVAHIRQFVDAAHAKDKLAVVHMCGHLRDLMPLFPETGMDGIDCLTPPPVGNAEFRYSYETMPARFFCTGRFGTSLWWNKRRDEILANLGAILPHDVYRDRAFTLGVTGDGMTEISLDNILLLRDCINEYDQTQ